MLFPQHAFSATFMATILAFFLFLFFLLWILRKTRKTTLPPEAGGAWPLIGHLHLLRGPKPAHITLSKMADKYGSLFTIQLGVHPALIVSNWEVAKECFTTHDKVFANRPKAIASELMGYNYALFVLSPYGPYWRQVRKIATVEVLSNHRLAMLKHIREHEVNRSIKEMYELWVKNNNMLVDMQRWFGSLALNIVFKMVVGKRFYGAEDEDENVGDDQCRQTLKDVFELSGTVVVADVLPYLRWLDFGGYEKTMKKTAKEFDHVLEGWLEEHKQRKVSGEGKGDKDFMDVMLSVVANEEKISNYDADTITKATCLSLVVAGADTTATTLTWAISLLLNNRKALKNAQQELDVQIGKDRQVKELDIKNLVYLQAIIKETMRLHPAASLSPPHESMEDCTLAGYHVPEGTRLLVNISKIHRDPNVWSDPNEFQPERFLIADKDVDVRGNHFKFIPFGSGRRVCPGISFALQVMHLTLATLLHAFEIATPLDELVDMTEKVGINNQKATPVEVHLTPRLPTQVYA
ncbi:cytochrome P450 CYP82D47-like [Corylus avellana]|uniref:cytochrome P450 CYP82D47-like n=1 Tax=Corylus avellana TaxID=13451 RepID=UPI001E1F7ED8|nr:cytochrome P450 CYP82D47-like [Corylus avellana]